MNACRIVDFLSRLPAIRPLMGRIVERHAETCRICRAALIDKEAARTLLVDAAGSGWPGRVAGGAAGLRPDRFEERSRNRRGRIFWLPAFSGAAAVLVLVLSGFWLLHRVSAPGGNGLLAAENVFRISYIEIGGEPANAYVFQPRDTDMVIVWAERRP